MWWWRDSAITQRTQRKSLRSFKPVTPLRPEHLPLATDESRQKMIGQKQMLETVDFEQAVEALTPRQLEVLASRLNSHAVEHERLLAYVAPKNNQRPSVAEL